MRTGATLALACVLAAVAIGGCTSDGPGDEPAAETASPIATESVTSGTLIACVTPTPALVERADDGWAGYDVGVLRVVAEELALDLELLEVTFDELVSGVALNGGRCDLGAAGVVDHDALESVVRTSSGYRSVHRVVVATTSGPDVAPAEVEGTVGVLEGGPAADSVESLGGAEVVPYPSSADLQRALAAGAVDAVLVTVMERARLEADLGQSLHLRSRVETDDQTVLLLPLGAADEDVEAVDAALAAASEDGRLAALAQEWLAD